MGERRKVRTARYDGEVGAVSDHVVFVRYIERWKCAVAFVWCDRVILIYVLSFTTVIEVVSHIPFERATSCDSYKSCLRSKPRHLLPET
jgi:hypothetical protein